MNIILLNKYKDESIYLHDNNEYYFVCPYDDVPLYTGLNHKLDIYMFCILCEWKRWVGTDMYNKLQKDYSYISL